MVLAAAVVKPQYEAKASTVLVPPRSHADPHLNRYMALGGLDQSVDVVARSMTSEETVNAIVGHVPDAKFEVVHDLATSAPIITVDATSSDPQAATKMLRVVLARLSVNLKTLQASLDIKPADRISMQVLAQDQHPQTGQKSRVRILGALAAALIFGSAVFVAAADQMLVRRTVRRARRRAEEDGGDAPPVGWPVHEEPTRDRDPGGSTQVRDPIQAGARARTSETPDTKHEHDEPASPG